MLFLTLIQNKESLNLNRLAEKITELKETESENRNPEKALRNKTKILRAIVLFLIINLFINNKISINYILTFL